MVSWRHVFGVGEIPEPAGGELWEALPKSASYVLNRAVGGACGRVGWTFVRVVPHCG